MAKRKRKRTLIYSPSCTVEPGGYLRAVVEVYQRDQERPCFRRMWRFRKRDAEAVMWDIEHFETVQPGTYITPAVARCLVADVKRTLRDLTPLELSVREGLKVRRG